MIKEFKTRTGAIFCDTDKTLEWLYVGDYGKENNLKADFLGLTKEIQGVKHHSIDLSKKMVVTISTQKGRPMDCKFCDCPKVGFRGNISREELCYQVEEADAVILGSPVYYGGITSQMKSFLTKLFYSHPHCLEHKVIATFVSSRRAGSLMALSEFNAFFLMHSCIIVGSTYWNEIYGDDIIEAAEDSEGIQTLKNLATNVRYIAKAIRNIEFPNIDKITHLNFIARKELIKSALYLIILRRFLFLT